MFLIEQSTICLILSLRTTKEISISGFLAVCDYLFSQIFINTRWSASQYF